MWLLVQSIFRFMCEANEKKNGCQYPRYTNSEGNCYQVFFAGIQFIYLELSFLNTFFFRSQSQYDTLQSR